jgi:hypothetical protein
MADLLLLCHSSTKTKRLVNRLRVEGKPVKWLFLCQDYLRLLECQKAVGALADHIEIGAILDQIAGELRKPFLDLITKLGRRYDSIAWWASRLSERNTMVSPLFLYCCYLKVAQDALENNRGRLCVIAESWEVLEALAEIARERRLRVVWVKRPVLGSRESVFLMRTGVRLSRFVAGSMKQRRHDSSPALVNGDRPAILLRTWVDEGCFGAGGVFNDRYLPGLCEWLEGRGFAVTTIPVLFNLDRSYRSAWEWLRNSRQKFLNPFRYYHLADYLFAFKQAWRQLGLRSSRVDLKGLNVSRLFDAERKRAFGDDCSIESILSYRLPERLASSGHHVDVLIDGFENMVPEKPFILGFRRYLPTAKLVGFQHGALYPLLLCNFVTPGEAEFAPIPDRVVCNGDFFREILINEGLPADRAVVGPALRYAHLREPMSDEAAPIDDQSRILVPLPLVLDSAVELLTKVVSALKPLRNVQTMVKPHPMSSREALLTAANLQQLPSKVDFVTGGMGELLRQSKLVIALSSSTVHEALAAGVPVIVVGREAGLDLNPLGWYDDLNRVFRSPEELREEVLRLLALSPGDLEKYRQRAREVLERCFGPVTEPAMHAFINGLVNTKSSRTETQSEPRTDTALVPTG